MKAATAILSALFLVESGGMVLAAAKPAGDEIQFTAPRESGAVRPLTGSEGRDRRFSFERRESGSVDSQLPAGAALPAPDEVNRARLLQQLIERRAGRGREDLGMGDSSSGDPSMDEASGGLMGIDDLFERPTGRREGGEGGEGGERVGESGGEGRRDRNGERVDGPGSRDDGEETSPTEAEIRDAPFLPGMDGPSVSGRNPSQMGGRSDNFFETGRLLSRGSLARDKEEANRYKAERLEFRQRLLGITPGSAGISPGFSTDLKSGAGGILNVPGSAIPGPGGPRTGGGESLSSRFGAIPGAGGAGAVPDRLALPGRGSGLDLGIGQGAGRSLVDRVAPTTPALRPMELFQRKHDSRIPTRGF
ncbi:MAG: hypothetical protein Q7T30_01555 [Planctomycetota bacterium]|nr:hypothetical protein [Planctomycetota bacterium]